MHVILTILKILGIILLVLLGLLLVIVFSVLFVPVRYRLEGEKSSPGWSEANGKVRVSWLLHLIHLRIQYQEKELDWECYLFGVPLKKAGAAVREWKKKRRKKKVQEQLDAADVAGFDKIADYAALYNRTDATAEEVEQAVEDLKLDILEFKYSSATSPASRTSAPR